MKQSDQISELAAALARAQAAMKGALADSSNPHFKSRYADLESVRSACIPALTTNGLAVVQGLSDGKCITRLVHSSGQWIETEVPLIIGKNDMQGVGSAITYARRYGLAAAVCLSQTDDDGNAACSPAQEKATVKPSATKPVAVQQTNVEPQYLDDEASKKWLVSEFGHYGIKPSLEFFKKMAGDCHRELIGKTRAQASKAIEEYAIEKGFKKG